MKNKQKVRLTLDLIALEVEPIESIPESKGAFILATPSQARDIDDGKEPEHVVPAAIVLGKILMNREVVGTVKDNIQVLEEAA